MRRTDGLTITLIAAAAIAENQCVKVDSAGKAVLSTVNSYGIGNATRAAAIGEPCPIFIDKGISEGISDAAIAMGALVYAVAAGKMGVTSTAVQAMGICTKAAAGADVKFEYCRF